MALFNLSRWLSAALLLGVPTIAVAEFTSGTVTYDQLGASEVTVTRIAWPDYANSDTEVVVDIPATVVNDGITYDVVAVGYPVGDSRHGYVFDAPEYYYTGKMDFVVKLPASLCSAYPGTFTGSNAFSPSIEFADGTDIVWPAGLFANARLNRLIMPDGRKSAIPNDFCRNAEVNEVILPGCFTSIGDYAFAMDAESDKVHLIKHFEMNYGLETIGYKAFFNNSPITKDYNNNDSYTLCLPTSLTSIGESAFEGMKRIYTVKIPSSLKVIPRRAFAEWKRARSISIPEGVERIEDEAFAGNGGAEYVFPYGNSYYGVYNFYLPSTVTYVGKDAFNRAEQLISVGCYGTTPPETAGRLTSGYTGVYLMVPKQALFKYVAASNWNEYKVEAMRATQCNVMASVNIKGAGTVTGGGTYKSGAAVALTATAASGYEFLGWMRGGSIVSRDITYKTVARDEAFDVVAVFAPTGGAASSKPDELYSTVNYTPGNMVSYIASYGDIALNCGLDRLTDWEFDFPEPEGDLELIKIKGECIHAQSDKYASREVEMSLQANVSCGSYQTYYGASLPDSNSDFPLTGRYDADGNLLPACAVKMYLPIKNRITAERDTLAYTVDVFMPGQADPIFNRDFYADEALQIYDKEYGIFTDVAGLDMKNGFDFELTVTEKNTSTGATRVINSIEKHYKAGQLTPDSKDFADENSYMYVDRDLRYASVSPMITGTMSGNNNYVFTMRARNYNADGTPRKWIEQSVGKANREVDYFDLDAYIKHPSAGYDLYGFKLISEDIYFPNRDASSFNNQALVDYIMNDAASSGGSDFLNKVLAQLCKSYTCELIIDGYPAWWGRCELWVEDPENPEEAIFAKSIKNKNQTVRIEFPADGNTHKMYLRWPEVYAERTIVFTDCMPEKFPDYEFNVKVIGGGSEAIKDLYLVYQTDDDEITGKVIKYDDWHGAGAGSFNHFYLREERAIKRVVSLTDTVPEGTAHAVIVPARLDNVKSLRSVVNGVSRIMIDAPANRGDAASRIHNEVTLYGFENMYLRLVDATTGAVIRRNITVNMTEGASADFAADIQVNGTVKIPLYSTTDVSSSERGLRPIIYADGYVPFYFKNGIKVIGHSIDADGYVGYADENGKVTITIPMRRRVDRRPFDVVNVSYRTPGIDAVKEKYTLNDIPEWTSVCYSGPETRIPFESGFRPVINHMNETNRREVRDFEQPILSMTVVYYDPNYKYTVPAPGARIYNKTDLGPLTSLKLRSAADGREMALYPTNAYSYFGLDKTMFCYGGAWESSEALPESVGLVHEMYLRGAYFENSYITVTHNPNTKYTFVTYKFMPHSFIAPERESKVTVALQSGHTIDLGIFKNLSEDAMYMAEGVDYDAPVGEEHIAEVSSLEDLGDFKQTFADFEIELPTDNFIPFNIGVQKINNDYVLRGVASVNFLPGGQYSDLIDKVSFAADIDNVFFNLQRSLTNDEREYAREERALCPPSAFVGLRGWVEGRFTRNKSGHFVPRPSGIGIKVESSGFVCSKLWTPLFQVGAHLGGEMSTYVALEYPSDEDLAWGVSADSKFPLDVVQHTTVDLTTGFYAQAGLDVYIARAICGVKGSLGGSFDSEIRYKPYLKSAAAKWDTSTDPDKPESKPEVYTYSGSRMRLNGSLEAFAEVKFLFWSKRWSHNIFSFNKTWYDPDDYTNPIKYRDDQEDDGKAVTRLRSSIYEPLQLTAAPLGSSILFKDIDAYAQPRYLFGGKDLVYYKINAGDMFDSRVMFRSGASFNGGIGEPIISIDAASAGSDKAIVAYEVSTASREQAFDQVESPRHVGVKAAVNTGSGWSAPVLLSAADEANYTPRAAIDADGRAAVVWKGGEYVTSDIDPETGGAVDGSLYLCRYDGGRWLDEQVVTATTPDIAVTDYAVAMNGGKPFVLAVLNHTNQQGDAVNELATVTIDADGAPHFMVNNAIRGINPQLVAVGDKLYGAALVVDEEDNKSDVHLFTMSDDGQLTDLGSLGLTERGATDFRLVSSASSLGLIWKESTEKIADAAADTKEAVPTVYGALVSRSSDADGNDMYYLSCPQPLAEATGNLDISYYDAYLPDDAVMTAAVTLYDGSTDGANVVENTVYFDNDISIRHAAIDTEVERGCDFGYNVVIFNEGKDMIDYVDMQLGDDGVTNTFPVNIYPGHSEVLSDMVLYTTDLEQGLVPHVTPHFNAKPLTVRSYEQAARQTAANLRASRRAPQRAQAAPSRLRLRVVDMDVSLLNVAVSGSDLAYTESPDTVINVDDFGEFADAMPADYTTVLLTVNNNSPISLQSDYVTNVGLYLDPNGIKPYDYAEDVNISAATFNEAGGSAVARILVGMVPEDIQVYAVAHTVNAQGNVVKDQNMRNNAVPVVLKKNDLTDIPSEIEDVVVDNRSKHVSEAVFTVSNTVDGAVVSGLVAGQTLRVYDVGGMLHHLYRVSSDEADHAVDLPHRGIYIFTTGSHTVKFRH